jgi:hypothetical protein
VKGHPDIAALIINNAICFGTEQEALDYKEAGKKS